MLFSLLPISLHEMGEGGCGRILAITNKISMVPYDAVNRNKVFNTSTRFYFFFLLTTRFGPYGPSSGEIYNWMLQWTISNATDPLHVRDPMQRCYMLHIGAPTLHSQYMLSHGNKYKSCRHVITCIGNAKLGR
jgi:hypothetical protein